MILLKSQEEIEQIRKSSLLVGRTLAEVGKHIKPGVTTAFLDKIGEQFIRDNGATPVFKGYGGFPSALCISINDEIVHGFPSDKRFLEDGDIVSIDCGTDLNGFIGDSAYTFMVGEVKPEVQKLLKVTKEALYLGVEKCVEGNRLGDIGHAIQTHIEKNGFSVVREMCGHGVGIKLHEDPNVCNYGKPGTGPLLKAGMVFAIEPMVNLGSKNVKFINDGWTPVTKDGKPSAHFEHDVAIGKDKADLLSTFEEIEKLMTNQQ
ncbi:MAG: type I methionyl aminopeptidase [Bacteroidales bacterium]|nr:type I methionyl aminopeptidase [Bacteroidales bacterium]MBR5778112.1 type I methionyl aminopeptidase [Bacteroidales bacterium]